jgi:hypothetical protein
LLNCTKRVWTTMEVSIFGRPYLYFLSLRSCGQASNAYRGAQSFHLPVLLCFACEFLLQTCFKTLPQVQDSGNQEAIGRSNQFSQKVRFYFNFYNSSI